MNIEQLTYIVEVAKTESLARAAKTLNISQSALSQAITRLESELNLKIFNRSRTGAVTTKEGESIVEKSKHALYAIYQIKEEAKKQVNNSNDLLKITVIPGLIGLTIDNYMNLFVKESNLKIEVNEKASMEIIEDIKNDKIDIGFIAINKANLDSVNDLNFTPVIAGEILVYASKKSPLANSKEVITTDLLKEQTFVLYKDEYVQEFISTLQRLHGPIDILLKTTNLDVINKAVTELGAVTIGHDISVIYNPNLHSNKMKELKIVDFSDTSFRFGWVSKSEIKLSKVAKLYIEEINKTLLKQKHINFTKE